MAYTDAIKPPNGFNTGDVNLSWDSFRSRFVFTLVDLPSAQNVSHSIWYGYSNDAQGSSWAFGNGGRAVLAGNGSTSWDYPSIGVDINGRIIIGAVNQSCSQFGCSVLEYDAAISTDGQNFGAPATVTNSTGGSFPGAFSRVAAAGALFEAFVPTISGNLPVSINRYESSDGVHWPASPVLVMNFDAPDNDRLAGDNSTRIFYAPELAAAGYTDGRWIVGWQRKFGDWNNVEVCTSDRNCFTVNPADDDEFLAGVSVSADGYWVSYHAYSTLETRALPLITQVIYIPTGSGELGATNHSGIDPTSWILTSTGSLSVPSRCILPCYGAGDFNTPSSNPFRASNTAFVQQSARQTDLFQTFQQDPQGQPNVPNFKPNPIPHPIGADLRGQGTPGPSESRGVPPTKRH